MGDRNSLIRTIALTTLAMGGCLGPSAAGPAEASGAAAPGSLHCVAPCAGLVDEGPGRPWEPMVAADPTDPMHLVAGASEITVDETGSERRWNYAYVSLDGGNRWQKARLPGGPGAGLNHPLASTTDMGDPVVAILPGGTVLFVGLATNFLAGSPATNPTVFVARSSDGGLTYPEVSIVKRGAGPILVPEMDDKPWLAVDGDGVAVLAWTNIVLSAPASSSNPTDAFRMELHWSLSTDEGRSWTAPKVLATHESHDYNGVRLLFSPDGTWYAVSVRGTLRDRISARELYLSSSTDRGASWRTRVIAVDASGRPDPQIHAIPDADGNEQLVLVYARARGGGTEDPVIRTSADMGQTWSEPFVLDEARFPASALPESAVTSDGLILVTYYLATTPERAEYRMALVRDSSVAARLVLDSHVTIGENGFGDYMGLAVVPGGAAAIWVSHKGGALDLVAGRIAVNL